MILSSPSIVDLNFELLATGHDNNTLFNFPCMNKSSKFHKVYYDM